MTYSPQYVSHFPLNHYCTRSITEQEAQLLLRRPIVLRTTH